MHENVKLGIIDMIISVQSSRLGVFLITKHINFFLIKKCILCIGLDKGGYMVNIFLISPQKCMLCVLIRSA